MISSRVYQYIYSISHLKDNYLDTIFVWGVFFKIVVILRTRWHHQMTLSMMSSCRESKNSDSWFVNQFKNWFESWFESSMIRESLLHKKLWIFDSRINLESNRFKKRFESTFSLCFSKKIATRFESRIIDSGSRQALICNGKKIQNLSKIFIMISSMRSLMVEKFKI